MKTALIFLVSFFAIKSCNVTGEKGNGNIVSKEIAIEDYSKLKIDLPAELIYEQKVGVAPYFRIEIDENLLEYVSVEAKDGSLLIKNEKDEFSIEVNNEDKKSRSSIFPFGTIKPTKCNIYTNSTRLKEVAQSGSGKIILKDSIKTPHLELKLAGSGNIVGEKIVCDDLEIEVAGSGTVDLGGFNRTSEIKIAGSGDVKLFKLESYKVECKIAGSGNVEVNAVESLKVSIAGSGDVKYLGEPSIEKKIAGSGSVEQVK